MTSGPARVLEALRRAGDGSCSGETLSREQGKSRAQIWKDVETLRARGYSIDATPAGGYRLTGVPDRLFPEEIEAGLETRWLARDIRWLDETDSTNRVALELARAGAPHGTAVIAEGQTAGRGRLGRSYYSPPYRNLYTTLVLRPTLSIAEAPTWTLAAAVAVAQTVEAFVPDARDVEIKWPNDVLLCGRKTCGILVELGAEAARVAFLVLGIGVNLNVDREEFPEEFRAHATSLRSHSGAPVDRIAFAQTLYGKLESILDLCAEHGFARVRPEFEDRFHMRGQTVRVVEFDGTELSGQVVGIAEDGALLLRDPSGRDVRVIAGDVTVAKESA